MCIVNPLLLSFFFFFMLATSQPLFCIVNILVRLWYFLVFYWDLRRFEVELFFSSLVFPLLSVVSISVFYCETVWYVIFTYIVLRDNSDSSDIGEESISDLRLTFSHWGVHRDLPWQGTHLVTCGQPILASLYFIIILEN